MAAAAPPKTTGSMKLDGAIQKIAAKEPQKLSGINLYSRFVSIDDHFQAVLSDITRHSPALYAAL